MNLLHLLRAVGEVFIECRRLRQQNGELAGALEVVNQKWAQAQEEIARLKKSNEEWRARLADALLEGKLP